MLNPNDRPSICILAAAATVLAGCAAPPPAVVAPAPDAEQIALALEGRTALTEPIRVLFDWQLNEAGVRVRGRGVARIEPPYKARLDLFMGNNETLARAALVDGDLRLPPGTPENVLPPADLMWGVLGVFRPRLGTELLGAERMEGGGLRLRYRYPDRHELRYNVLDGAVRSLELVDDGHVVERVELGSEDGSRYPAEATYRNLAAFRELKLTRSTVESVEAYPPDIWDPVGREVR